jgi:5'-nucleotidase
MKKRPHILISNDDGIHAIGIKHLAATLAPYADLTIVAPAFEQSGMGLAISLNSPLKVEKHDWEGEGINAWSVTGTPADCVKMALSVILPTLPDLIVSGINRGANHGRSVLYSGTVGATIEGTFRGVNSIAFSSFDLFDTEYLAFTPFIPKIVQYVIENPLPLGTLLNVNFPRHTPCTPEKSYEVKLTRQGMQYWAENPEMHKNESYILGAKLLKFNEHEESDAHLLSLGYITASPIHVSELTDLQYIDAQKTQFEELFTSSLETLAP